MLRVYCSSVALRFTAVLLAVLHRLKGESDLTFSILELLQCLVDVLSPYASAASQEPQTQHVLGCMLGLHCRPGKVPQGT